MNPELLRNLWLEAPPLRLGLIAAILLLVFAAVAAGPQRLATPAGAALALYWFFAVLWGTRSAALSVVGEIRERTWDSQKLSSLSPAAMMWGKLLGATSANWFGALLCLPLILMLVWREQGGIAAVQYGVILLALGLFAQGAALLSSLAVIRRQTGNWRLDIFLCQVAGVLAAFAYYSLWSSAAAFTRSGEQALLWWGHAFNLSAFHFVSLLLFLGWVLVGCWRAMRAELCFANGPYVWLAWLAYLCVYDAGFASDVAVRLNMDAGAALPLALAWLALLASTYGMAFLEPKSPVRLRWLGERVRSGQAYKAFLALDAWMLGYGAALILGLVLAGALAASPASLGSLRLSALALPVLAMLGFFTRDLAIFVAMRGGRGDFAALAILGASWLLLPLILAAAGLAMLRALFLPLPGFAVLSVAAAWAQGIGAVLWARHRTAAY